MSLAGHSPCKRRGLDIAMVVPVTTCENRFVLAQKMFHPSGEMRKVPQGNGNGHGASGLLQPSEKRTTPPPPASAPASEFKDSRVMFQTHDGLELQGVPVRVTRHHVVFELYNPGTTPGFPKPLMNSTLFSRPERFIRDAPSSATWWMPGQKWCAKPPWMMPGGS